MKSNILIFALMALSAMVYINIAYGVERNQFVFFIGHIVSLFAAYWLLYKKLYSLSLTEIITAGVFFRLLFLISIPSLSDDYFRFIWDGQLISYGLNPYLEKPLQAIQHFSENPFFNELLENMNSPNYFTVYPPLHQFLFFIAATCGAENILYNLITMRLLILLAEIGSAIMLIKLKISKNLFYLFFLNPLLIIELCGNLHFEAVMIFFLLTSFYFLKKENHFFSAFFLGLAISIKLIPFIFLPFIAMHLRLKKGIIYILTSVSIVVILFLPFLSKQLLLHVGSSLQLYFLTFEFNASIYYIIRELGYLVYGYNIISIAGKILPLITICAMLILLFKQYKVRTEQKLFASFLFALFTYYLLSSVVHPWYVSTLVLLGVLSNYVFPVVWSGLAFLSYHAYGNIFYYENKWLISAEYLLLTIFFIYEWRKKGKEHLLNAIP